MSMTLIEKNSSRLCLGVSIEIVIPVKTGIQIQNFGFWPKGQNLCSTWLGMKPAKYLYDSALPEYGQAGSRIVGFKKFFICLSPNNCYVCLNLTND